MKLPTVKTDIQLRHSDLDSLGHVSNTIYGQYLELSRLEWFQATGEPIPAATVHLSIDFMGEIRLGDKVYVTTACSKVGNTSVELAQKVYANDRCVTKAKAVVVGFDMETRRPAPVPSDWEPSASEDPETP